MPIKRLATKLDFPWYEPLLLGFSVAFAYLLIALNYEPYNGWIDRCDRYFGNDFLNFWFGPWLAAHGQVSVLPSFEGYFAAVRAHFGDIRTYYNWSYPPQTLLLLWPLAQLPYHVAFFAFIIGSLWALLTVGLRLLQPQQPVRFLWLSALAPASLFNMISGQNGYLTGALLLGGFLSIAGGRQGRGGLLFGIMAFKPQLGLLVPVALIAQRRWQAVVAAAATLALLVAASIVVYGVQPWVDYLTVIAEYQRHLLEHDAGYYAEMLVSAYAAYRTLGLHYYPAMAAQGFVSIVCVALVVAAFRAPATLPQKLLVLCTAMPLAVPYSMAYDLPAVSLLIAGRLCEPGKLDWRKLAYLGLWLGPSFFWIAQSRTNCMIPLYLALALFAAWDEATNSSKSVTSPAP